MTDATIESVPQQKDGAGKFWTVLLAGKIATLICYIANSKFHMEIDPTAAVEMSGDLLALLSWIARQDLVDISIGWIKNYKRIKKEINSP